MIAPDFLDTNILISAYDVRSPGKQRVARELLAGALAGAAVISNQVLAELSSALLHKISPASSCASLLVVLDAIEPIRVVLNDADTIRRAAQMHERYGIRFYDGLILASAEKAGCKRVWSEELNPGQSYFSVAVQNPFA